MRTVFCTQKINPPSSPAINNPLKCLYINKRLIFTCVMCCLHAKENERAKGIPHLYLLCWGHAMEIEKINPGEAYIRLVDKSPAVLWCISFQKLQAWHIKVCNSLSFLASDALGMWSFIALTMFSFLGGRSKEIESVGCNGDAAFLEVRVQQLVIEFILNHVDEIFNDNVSARPKENEGEYSWTVASLSAVTIFNSLPWVCKWVPLYVHVCMVCNYWIWVSGVLVQCFWISLL